MTIDSTSIEKVVEILESAKLRKGMYFSPVTVESADTWLAGFFTGCFAFGVFASWADIHAAMERRGWEVTATGPISQMREKGLTDEEVIDELFDIHINAVRHLAHG